MSETPEAVTSRPVELGPVRAWIVGHDQSLVFALAYIGLAVVLSIFVSLFWLLVIVAAHVWLEWLKKCYLGYRAGTHRMSWTLWDVKYDIALLCLAFALASYTGASMGVAGAQSAGRAGLLGGRLGWVARALRGFRKPMVDAFFAARVALFRKADMARAASQGLIAAGAVSARAADGSGKALAPTPQQLPWQRRWTKGDWFALAIMVVNLVAIGIAPLITDHTYPSLFEALAFKLHPWPTG